MVHGANMGPIWGRQDPGGPHVGPMNFAIWAETNIIYFPIMHYCLRQQTGQNQWNQWVANLLHICVHKQTIIGPDNGLLLGQHQAIIWSNAGILLIQTLGTNFTEILSEIHTFSFKKMHLKMLSLKLWQFSVGFNVLITTESAWSLLIFWCLFVSEHTQLFLVFC